ncbi:hypothetical protein GmHk_07G019664 [Glycine max]|nr:hypothetical protein GmHk_07G019664 [Glycine max]
MKGKAPMTEISSVEVEKGSKVDREKELRTIQYLQQIGETFVFGGINRIYNMVGKVYEVGSGLIGASEDLQPFIRALRAIDE